MATQVFAPDINISFWWVNHKQTARVEIEEGYIWSPKRNNAGAFSQGYHNLTLAKPGDIIFSYADGKIPAVGKIIAKAQEKEKPEEFGKKGQNWDKKGWLVQVEWRLLSSPLIPKFHLSIIVPLLPEKYAPIRANGHGNEGMYLANISSELGNLLLSLVGHEDFSVAYDLEEIDSSLVEEACEDEIQNQNIPDTEKKQLIRSRIGQGLFRSKVAQIESKCRVTGVSNKSLLIASHMKPWKDSTNEERLDGHNGLLLAPHIDKLFDKGWISFSDEGQLLISPKLTEPILQSWHIHESITVGAFSKKQRQYLAYHRNNVFKS
jgi:hypothetical protein